MVRRFVPPSGMVEICGLNSSSLEAGRNSLAGMGRIDENTYRTVANELSGVTTRRIWLFDCQRFIIIRVLLKMWKGRAAIQRDLGSHDAPLILQ